MTGSRVLAAALAGALVLAAVLGLRAAGWLQPLELAVYDQYVRRESRAPGATVTSTLPHSSTRASNGRSPDRSRRAVSKRRCTRSSFPWWLGFMRR